MITILHGDCIEQMRTLPDESVQCSVSSPPFWGLRDYGIPPSDWPEMEYVPFAGLPPVKVPAMSCCLGLEPTPRAFIGHMVLVYRGVQRVLRNDGTCWMNLGDSYCGSGKGRNADGSHSVGGKQETNKGSTAGMGHKATPCDGLKPKDLVGIPWRVAFALQADGWYLRSDIIWHKPNPMPESVTDRPTTAHEHIFLLTKSEKYFYDAEAIKEPVTGNAHARGDGLNPKAKTPEKNSRIHVDRDPAHLRAKPSRQNESFSAAVVSPVSKRNKRTVWTVATAPCREAHFATYPPNLIKPCILAGTSAFGACADCGAPYEAIIEKGAADIAHQKLCGGDTNGEYHGQATKDFAAAKAQNASAVKARILAGMREKKIIGWQSTCKCRGVNAIAADSPAPDYVKPCVVLDPFGGSGTTGQVAMELGRKAILIELNPTYIALIHQRTNVTPGSAL